ncbi:MAG: MFS transporter [Oscillospiraceae bacterium]|nr:MFS transporter [Oscillospiraceae bacterium]
MEKKTPEQGKKALWTRDFTIITVGSVVSMLGTTLSSFAMDLMVLDHTGSTLLFAIYNILFMLPNTLSPILIGPLLDRFSRKKTIYTLDFISSGMFAFLALLLITDHFNFYFLAIANMIFGAISGIYFVAYDSFYPLLISEGNYQKAYSVSATLETLTMVMVPVSTFIYKTFGIVPLFLANTLTYLIAAIMETQIRAQEDYIALQAGKPSEHKGLRRFTADFEEGMRYLFGEKGLLAVAVYFLFSSMTGGMTGVVTLPYFRNTYHNGEYVYMLTWGMASLARAFGGLVHYNIRLPEQHKFKIALGVYLALSLLEGTYLFTPIPVMMVMTALTGILGVTSYNIRISSTQKYVPDEKKGRFNGTFNTLSTVGALMGQALAGALSVAVGERMIVVLANVMCFIAAVVFIGGGRKEVAKIYNTQA